MFSLEKEQAIHVAFSCWGQVATFLFRDLIVSFFIPGLNCYIFYGGI